MVMRARVLVVAASLWVVVGCAPARAEASGFLEDLGKALLVMVVVGAVGLLAVSTTIIPLAANGAATVDGERSSGTWRALGWIGGGVDLAVGVPMLVEGFRGLRRTPREGGLFYAGIPITLLGVANLTLATTAHLQPEGR